MSDPSDDDIQAPRATVIDNPIRVQRNGAPHLQRGIPGPMTRNTREDKMPGGQLNRRPQTCSKPPLIVFLFRGIVPGDFLVVRPWSGMDQGGQGPTFSRSHSKHCCGANVCRLCGPSCPFPGVFG